MSSAGSVLFTSGEQEEDIYVEPDGPSDNATVLPIPTLNAPPSTPPPVFNPNHPSSTNPKKHSKPATLPKPKVLQADSSRAQVPSTTPPAQGEPLPPAATSADADDDYVSPEVFKLDTNQQNAEVLWGDQDDGCSDNN